MRQTLNSFRPYLAGITLALVFPAQAAVTVETVHGAATVSRLGAESALNPGDPVGERDVVSVASGGALRLRFVAGDSVELGGDTVIAIERLPDVARPTENKTILSLDHGLLRVIRPGGDDLVLPFHLFLGDQRAALSEGDFYFERAPRLVEACVDSGQLSLPPTEFLPMRVVSGQNCYHNAGGDGPPRILQRDQSYFSQARLHLGLTAAAPVVASAPPTASSIPPAPGSTIARGGVQPPAVSASGAMVASVEPVPINNESNSSPASETAVPAPAAEPAPATTDWTVNLASFSQIEQANEEVQRLQAAGYPAAVESKEVAGVMHYRVQLRSFVTADAARSAANEVASRFGYKDYFLIRTP
jgi:hypothetical protein